jgi:uncharacterized membrane protein
MMGYREGYGYGGDMMGVGWLGGLLMLLFAALVVAGFVLLVIWAVRASSGHTAAGPALHPGMAGHHEAVAIAKKRLASGEITADQYDEIIAKLGG